MKFIPAFKQAKEWVASGRIGDIKLVRADLSSFALTIPTTRMTVLYKFTRRRFSA